MIEKEMCIWKFTRLYLANSHFKEESATFKFLNKEGKINFKIWNEGCPSQ